MKRIAVAGFIALTVALAPVTHAQYTADYQTNIISGVTNSWWDYFVGGYFSFDVLLIQNGGVLSDSYGGVGVAFFNSEGNSALVTGSGSVWDNTTNFLVGDSCSRNELVIRNGGKVLNGGGGFIGHNDYGVCSNNTVLVFDAGSMWRSAGDLEIGGTGSGWNSLIISNGGQVFDQSAYVGTADNASNNSVLVTGSSSVWSNRGSVYIGDASAGNTLTISNGGRAFAGSLVVGRLMLDGGSLTVDSLIAGNGLGSSVEFVSGTLTTKGTVVSNGTVFAVGDGIQPATFCLMNGVHSFADGLRIRTNGTLRGCGEVRGNMLVEGSVLADCGGTLLFTDVITNNGTIELLGGTFLDCHGRLVNHGTIIATNGTLRYYSIFENNGSIVGTVQDKRDVWTNPSSGKWEVAAHWSLGAPTNGSSCIISNGGSKTVTIDAITASAHPETLTVESLTLVGTSAITNKLLLSDSGSGTPLRMQHELIVGTGGDLAVSNGAVEVGVFAGRSLTIDGRISMSAAILTVTNGPTLLGTTGVGEMTVSNSTVSSGDVRVGCAAGSSGNLTVVGGGTLWSNSGILFMGDPGSGNSLVMSDGGQMVSGYSYLGYGFGSTNNNVVVTGTGSVWYAWSPSWDPSLNIGYQGGANSLVISNGGMVITVDSSPEPIASACLGCTASSSNNVILITGPGSVFSNQSGFIIGYGSSGNKVMISSGGELASIWAGFSYGSYGNGLVVSGFGSIAKFDYSIDIGGYGNSLFINDGGQLNGGGTVGSWENSSNNLAVVTDPGSAWIGDITVGLDGSSNSFIISNGAHVVSRGCTVGAASNGNRNKVLVSGAGSVWSSLEGLTIGGSGDWSGGAENSLIVSNHGAVISGSTYVGYNDISTNNSVCVTHGGGLRSDDLSVGFFGSSNSLIVSDGIIVASNLIVGVASSTCDNLLQLDSGSVIVTNATTNAVLEVRQGKLILNGGTFQVDRFVMTNACAQFVRTGGTLIYGSAVLSTNLDADGDGMANGWEQASGLDPLNAADAGADNDGDGFTTLQEFQAGTNPTNASSVFRVLSLESTNNDILVTWQAGGGRTNVVQAAPDLAGSYSNVSPNIILPGSGEVTTNYLDDGGATNGASRYYRIRLIP